MNDQPDRLDQTDEEILASTVSDEALEAAAGTESYPNTLYNTCTHFLLLCQ
jgi:hypothetical protein